MSPHIRELPGAAIGTLLARSSDQCASTARFCSPRSCSSTRCSVTWCPWKVRGHTCSAAAGSSLVVWDSLLPGQAAVAPSPCSVYTWSLEVA